MRKFSLTTITLLMTMFVMAVGTGNGSSKANAIDFDWVDGHEHVGTAWYRVDLSAIDGLVDPTLALYLTNLTDETVKVDVEEVSAKVSVSFAGTTIEREETLEGGSYSIAPKDYRLWSQNVKALFDLNVQYLYLKLTAPNTIALSAKKYETSDIVDLACENAVDFDWAREEVKTGESWYRLNLSEIKTQNKKLNFVVKNEGGKDVDVKFDLSLDCPASVVFPYNWTIPAGGEMTEEFGRIFIDELKEDYVYLKLTTEEELVLSVEEEVVPVTPQVTWSVNDILTEGKSYTFSGEYVFEVAMSTLTAPRGMRAEFVVTNNNGADVTLAKQISFANPVKSTIDKELVVEANSTVTKEVVNNMAGVINSETAYIRFTATDELTVQLNYVVENEEIMNAEPVEISTCENSKLLDWNSTVKQSGLEMKWYEIDLATIKQNDQHLQLSFTNHSQNVVVVMGEILPTCGAEDTIPYILPLPAGETISQLINYNLFALLPHPKHFKMSVTMIPTTAKSITELASIRSKEDIMNLVPQDIDAIQATEVSLVANTISAIVDPTDCNDAVTIARGVKYEQAAGETKWYRVTDDLVNKVSLFPDVAFINNGKKAANVTVAATVGCEYSTFGMSTIAVPTWADLTVFPSNLIGKLLDKAFNSDVKEMYIQVTTDQPIAFGIDIDYGFGLGCDDARVFDWSKGAVIEAGDAQWLDFDITSVKKNKQQVKLTLTNESNSTAWVAMLTSLSCPFKVALPSFFPIPAGMSIDKVVDYSYFAATKLDQLYIGLITEETISVKAVAEKSVASDSDYKACANAVVVENGGAYTHKPGTAWYKLDRSLFDDVSRLPKFRYAAEGNTNLTFGATVGCEYNIATKGTIKLPSTKGLEVSFRTPGFIYDVMKKFVNEEVTEVYFEFTTDQEIKFGMDMEYAGGCENATKLDFSKPLDIDLKADKDVWYAIDLRDIEKLGNKNITFNLNNQSGKDVEVEFEVSPTCPLIVSAIKSLSVPAGINMPFAVPASKITDIYDQVIAKFNLPEKIENNLPGQFYVYYIRIRANGDLSIDEGGEAPDVIEPGCSTATLLDITKPILVDSLKKGWYVVDMTTIKGDFTLSFVNGTGSNQTLDFDFYKGCDESSIEVMKEYWLAAYEFVVPTTGFEQFVPYSMISSYLTMDELYIYLEKEEGGEVDMACASAQLVDPTQPFEINLEAGKEQWFKFAPNSLENFKKNLKVSFVNPNATDVRVEFSLATTCPALITIDSALTIEASYSRVDSITAGMINLAMDEYGDKFDGIDTAYIRVLANGALNLTVDTFTVVVPDVPEGCENAKELDFSKTINLSDIQTGWYHVDLTPLKNGSVKQVSINNDLGKETGVQFDIFRNCEPSSFLYTYTHLFKVGLFTQSIPSSAISMLGSLNDLYIYITMDVDVLTCEDAIEFDWSKGAVHKAGDTQWYHFDITSVEENEQQVKLTFTNHSSEIAIVYGEVAMHCPYTKFIPFALPVPAGMSVDKVVDYSVFKASRVEELYVKVTSTETIELAASTESALVFDNTPCESAPTVQTGVEYKHAAGTSWYRLPKSLYMNTGKLPKFYFTTEEEGLTTITVGATVGCEYNIATKTIFMLPGSLNYAMVVPEQMFDLMDKFVSDDVTEVYVELTTDRPVHFSVDMVNNTDDACHGAELLDVTKGINLVANQDKWYKIDLDALKAMNSDVAVKFINPDSKDVTVDMEFSLTCPVIISANKSLTLPGVAEVTKVISQSTIAKIPGISFYVRFKASADVQIQFSEPEQLEGCEEAEEYIWGTDIQLNADETEWYKLALVDLQGQDCNITLTANNASVDTVRAAIALYSDCPISEDNNIISMAVAINPNTMMTQTVSSDRLPMDVDTIYLHVNPNGAVTVRLDADCLPERKEVYAYDTISSYDCVDVQQMWNDTVRVNVSATLDSVYVHTYIVNPFEAPVAMTDAILTTIPGAQPVLKQGLIPDMTASAEAIKAYYQTLDTEAIADVVNVTWNVTKVDCDAVSYTITLVVEDNCGRKVETSHTFNNIEDRPTGAETVAVICGGESYPWNGKVYTATGVYNDTVKDVNGCDSINVLNLTVLVPRTEEESVAICHGASYDWLVNGKTYSQSGTYTEVIPNYLGCDSIVYTLNLTVKPAAVYAPVESRTICYGDTVMWRGDSYRTEGRHKVAEQDVDGCDSVIYTLNLIVAPELITVTDHAVICDGDSYTWKRNNVTYNGAGQYSFIEKGQSGCDSVAYVLDLKVVNDKDQDFVTICYGDSHTIDTNDGTYVYDKAGTYTITLSSGCKYILELAILDQIPMTTVDTVVCGTSFEWEGTSYDASGSYVKTLHSASFGCDSVVTLNLTLNQPTTKEIYHSECDSYEWNGTVYTTTGKYYHTTTGSNGCDSTAILHLTINKSVAKEETIIACDSYEWNGKTYTESGVYTYNTTTATGCAHNETLYLTINKSEVVADTVTACDSYEWHGKTYTASGIYEYTYSTTTTTGCPRKDVLHLTIESRKYEYYGTSLCVGSTYTWDVNGKDYTYTSAGTYTDTYEESVVGSACPIVHELTLTYVAADSNVEEHKSICEGESYKWNGQVLTTSGTYTHVLDACNATSTLYLTVNPKSTASEIVVACDSYTWNGVTYYTSGDYTQKFESVNGCDSIVTIHLTINNSTTGVDTAVACESYAWGNQVYYASGDYTQTFTAANGCDSVVTLHLTILPPAIDSVETVTICYGETYEWFGQSCSANRDYYHTTKNMLGCDSINHTLHLFVRSKTPAKVESEIICYGDAFTWSVNGQTYTSSTVVTVPTQDANGCERNITLNLKVRDEIAPTFINVDIYKGQSYVWGNETLTKSGSYPLTFQSVVTGCDSVVTLNLNVKDKLTVDSTITEFVCDGNEYIDPITKEKRIISSLIPSTCTWEHTVTGVAADTVYHFEIIPIVAPEVMTDSILASINAIPVLNQGEKPQVDVSINAIKAYYDANDNDTISDVINITWSNIADTLACDAAKHAMILTVEAGCDNLLTMPFEFNVQPRSVSEVVTSEIVCYGETFTWTTGNGNVYNVSGQYRDTVRTAFGCDSLIRVLNLTVMPQPTPIVTNATICRGDSFYWDEDGEFYSNDTTASVYYQDVNGCDSILTLILTVKQPVTVELTEAACGSYTWNGQTYTTSGDYQFTTTAANGCDSTTILHLTIKQPVTVELTEAACGSYTWNGQTYTTSGDYQFTITAANGCDSTTILHLTINQPITVELTEVACGSYTWNDTTYTTSGDYPYTTTGANGCDSTTILHLTVNQSVATEETVVTCGSYTWNGTTYTTSGDYPYTTIGANGCDSVVTLHLTINQPVATEETVVTCGSYTWNGQTYTASGDYPFTTTADNGCDSIVTLHLTILPDAVTENETLGICEFPYEWRGEKLNSAGTYTVAEKYVGTDCDSVIHVLDIKEYVMTLPDNIAAPIAVCGNPVNVTDATADIEDYIASTDLYAPNAVVTWYIDNNGNWSSLTNDPIKGGVNDITVKYVITTDCGTLESDPFTVTVEAPTPENDENMDNIRVVSKYENRIFLLHLNDFESRFGWIPAPEEVSWYKVVGEVDIYGVAGDDIVVGTGHSYNEPDGSTIKPGEYYALIVRQEVEHPDDCHTTMRSMILSSNIVSMTPELVSNVVRPDDNLKVINLNSEEITEIRVYNMTGELIDTYVANQVSEFIFNAARVSGYYLVDIQTASAKTTLRYIVK